MEVPSGECGPTEPRNSLGPVCTSDWNRARDFGIVLVASEQCATRDGTTSDYHAARGRLLGGHRRGNEESETFRRASTAEYFVSPRGNQPPRDSAIDRGLAVVTGLGSTRAPKIHTKMWGVAARQDRPEFYASPRIQMSVTLVTQPAAGGVQTQPAHDQPTPKPISTLA